MFVCFKPGYLVTAVAEVPMVVRPLNELPPTLRARTIIQMTFFLFSEIFLFEFQKKNVKLEKNRNN